MDRIYEWKRFWGPRDEALDLSDGGFLWDPDSEPGRHLNSHVLPFCVIAQKRCVVFLGEPGIGKTIALDSERLALEKSIRDAGDFLVRLDLQSYGDEKRVIQDVFDAPGFSEWRLGDRILDLVLDSLDECSLRLTSIFDLLRDGLQTLPLDRLRLRLVCRTAGWPGWFEDTLKRLYDEVSIYELAPLRRIDVETALRAEGLDPSVFIDVIGKAEAVPLAIRPATLKLVIQILLNDGRLPATRWELYERGCRFLADEVSPRRKHSRLGLKLLPAKRLLAASRVGAITTFGNRFAAWRAADDGTMPKEDVAESEIAGGTESTAGVTVELDLDALSETFGTGLFTSRGVDRMGWAHGSYSEFLAARYLVDHDVKLVQILSLVGQISAKGPKVAPQMREVCGWIAMRRQDFVDAIAASDPEVLLRADGLNSAVRQRLTGALLDALARNKLHDFNLSRQDYAKLAHPQLAEQLQPYILGQDRGVIVRRVAIQIARACHEMTVLPDLLQVALDEKDNEHVRALAIAAIRYYGNAGTSARLKEVLASLGDDPNDEVKGNALMALWPKFITAHELFSFLTPAKKSNVIGTYHLFITTAVVPNLKPADLPEALDWALKNLGPAARIDRLEAERLIDKILLAAWGHLERTDLGRRFAQILLRRLETHYSVTITDHQQDLQNALSSDASKRRILIEAILNEALTTSRDSFVLWRLCKPEDTAWIIRQAADESDTARAQSLMKLALPTFSYDDRDTLEAFWDGAGKSEVVRHEFSQLYLVDLKSQLAAELREQYGRSIAHRSERTTPSSESLVPRITARLDEFEGGEASSWIRLIYQLRLVADDRPRTWPKLDLSAERGWETADCDTKKRILAAARVYIDQAEPHVEQWVSKNEIFWSALGGNRAFFLLVTEDPAALEELDLETLKKWVPSLMADPHAVDSSHREKVASIIGRTYKRVSSEIVKTARSLIEKEEAPGRLSLPVLDLLSECWGKNGEMEAALVALLPDTQLNPEQMGCILGDLLKHGNKEAIEFARSFLQPPMPTDRPSRDRAVVTARYLAELGSAAEWQRIWHVVQLDKDFGRTFIEQLAHRPITQYSELLSRLGEETLGNLYLWIEQQFPRDQDPDHGGKAYAAGPRDSVVDFRDSILQFLRSVGTFEAVEATRRMVRMLPHLTFLPLVLVDAETEARRTNWQPASPGQILKMGRDSRARLANSGEDVLEIVLEALRHVQNDELLGKTPQVKLLWNITKKIRRPKEEDDLSTFLVRRLTEYLAESGVILNREVQIYRRPNAGRGLSVDIVVDAHPGGEAHKGPRTITVIIEVKGCWNRELQTGMKQQLVGQYLKPVGLRFGMYLVGWFDPDPWDEDDHERKGRVPKWTVVEASEYFEKQSSQLSNEGRVIRSFVLDCSLPTADALACRPMPVRL